MSSAKDFSKTNAFLIDMTRCTGCRGCQVACKQWNQLPSALEDEAYEFSGSYEYPASLGPNTWLRITFNEAETDKGVEWSFGRDGCLHCNDAACEMVCPVGAISRSSTGALGLDAEKCIGCKYCVNACPTSVPNWDSDGNTSYKCRLCADRTANGLDPACVSTCPTQALVYGPRSEIVAAANERVSTLRAGRFPSAEVFGVEELGGTHVITVAAHGLEAHGLPRDPKVPDTISLWKLLKPLTGVGVAAMVGVVGASFLTGIGYKRDEITLDDSKKEVR